MGEFDVVQSIDRWAHETDVAIMLIITTALHAMSKPPSGRLSPTLSALFVIDVQCRPFCAP